MIPGPVLAGNKKQPGPDGGAKAERVAEDVRRFAEELGRER
jgi:hypothetical protein